MRDVSVHGGRLNDEDRPLCDVQHAGSKQTDDPRTSSLYAFALLSRVRFVFVRGQRTRTARLGASDRLAARRGYRGGSAKMV